MSKPEVLPYATVIAKRNPKLKYHKTVGQAKGAVSYRNYSRCSNHPYCETTQYGYVTHKNCGDHSFIRLWPEAEIWEFDSVTRDYVLKWSIPADTREEDIPWRQ